jgi:hypothetical protein
MAKQKTERAWLAFTAGELSPLLEGRADVDKMDRAAATHENMVLETTGRSLARPGLQFIALAKESEPDP